jgi:hypothetical protein
VTEPIRSRGRVPNKRKIAGWDDRQNRRAAIERNEARDQAETADYAARRQAHNEIQSQLHPEKPRTLT